MMNIVTAPKNLYGITRRGSCGDLSTGDGLSAQLNKEGVSFRQFQIPLLFLGPSAVLSYMSPSTGKTVTVLVVPSRYDSDGRASAEDYYYMDGIPCDQVVDRGAGYWVDVYNTVSRWPDAQPAAN